MKSHTILITGGHLTPAIATIEELKKRDLSLRMLFIGRTYATEQHQDLSHEKEEMDRLGISFTSITTGRIQRFASVQSLVSLLKIPVGLVQAFRICLKERPTCIVSFGGYVALPVVVSGWLLGVPSVTHEQTSVMGIANRIIALFAKKICVTFPEMLSSISKGKGVYTGLPIRKTILDIKRNSVGKKANTRQMVYITGGTTGATSVNELVYPILDVLTETYDVVHQTGRVSYDEAIEHKQQLSPVQRAHYTVYSYVNSDLLTQILRSVSFVVGRSGANTTIELATLGIPVICIPLPWSGGGEQQKNALWLASRGSAMVLVQSKTSPESLLKSIIHMTKHASTFQKHAAALAYSMPLDGASRFADAVISLL